MAITVQLWSGCEVRALREAKRLSIRDFAGKLGVSQRMVSKWEAGGESIHPRPANQDALDTFLAASSADVHARFAHMTGVSEPASPVTGQQPATTPQLAAGESNRARHPVDGKLMTLVDAGVFLAGAKDDPIWLPAFYVDVFRRPTLIMRVSLLSPATRLPHIGSTRNGLRRTSLTIPSSSLPGSTLRLTPRGQ